MPNLIQKMLQSILNKKILVIKSWLIDLLIVGVLMFAIPTALKALSAPDEVGDSENATVNIKQKDTGD
jgi:hypothetical protein